MSVKAKVEAVIYATEEPVTLNQLASLLKDEALAELRAAEEAARAAQNESTLQEGPVQSESEATPEFFDGERLEGDDLTNEQSYKRELKHVKDHLTRILEELTAEYAGSDHGVEIRQIAGGYRMATKPEHHDVVVGFAKSLKPPVRLSLPALETLAVIAYKQPVTVPEISEIRGVDTSGVIATLLDRKLITTAGRKQVIGRPILYKTTKEFLLRFGLDNVSELPSMEEFEKLGDPQADLFSPATEQSSSVPQGEPASETPSEDADSDPSPSPELAAEDAPTPDTKP
jgi:segregation and condensation protein B